MLMCRFNVAEVFIHKWVLIARDFLTFFQFFLARSKNQNLIKKGIVKKLSLILFDSFEKFRHIFYPKILMKNFLYI